MELVVADGAQQDGTPVGEVGTIVEHGFGFADDVAPANEDKVNGETTTEQENIQVDLEKGNIICADMGVVVEPVRGPCRNTEYGCPEESVTHTGKNDHEETCIYAPCSCPLQNCAFIGSSEQLSLHFSSKHQDSGRRFQYNCPLPVSLNEDEQFLVLQAEEDGLLFLLNKGVETIGHTLMVNRIGPSSSKEGFFYDLVSEKGTSSLRLKSCSQSFPGLAIGLPPVDFLLIPFGYASSSGQLSLEVSASVLEALFNASSAPDSLFEVAAIVTQPPSGRNRGKKVMASPVAQHALDRGFPSDLIFTPERAGEETFLSNLRALQPELCITAAYGNILPNKFLKIPPLGTVNLHPSLLPLYRGAAPVQRALQDGVKETGVSLAFTVRALDAGPIIASERMEVDDQIKAPDLLALLFSRGSKLLIHELSSILDGSARLKAQPQEDSQATLAPKCDISFSIFMENGEGFISKPVHLLEVLVGFLVTWLQLPR
ncbi:hypothetical protein RHSIM_Rhsim08G0084800 [Rhododendron simsii]|uniref:methionyl-tRNA formyltransferase n=1 Tax=Rhododendron simsii TaxID=118357 RepID=A0A834GJH8_RHOSS|nr:hypothetical protein RHSIM_Rhsim08G0084800 [Rhododendron simsii]